MPRLGQGRKVFPSLCLPIPLFLGQEPLWEGISGLREGFKSLLLQAELLRLSKFHCFHRNKHLPICQGPVW